jgi:hypothetical protein
MKLREHAKAKRPISEAENTKSTSINDRIKRSRIQECAEENNEQSQIASTRQISPSSEGRGKKRGGKHAHRLSSVDRDETHVFECPGHRCLNTAGTFQISC